MYELPLFPLNTVLFPATPLHLHIFEERYKNMINMCIEERRPFGVVLIQRGQEALGPPAEPHSIGCSAQIIHIQRLDQGRMNILALGKERFRILSSDYQGMPYLVGSVENVPIESSPQKSLIKQAEQLRQQVERFMRILARAGGESVDTERLPENPIQLAYTAAAILQIAPSQKQSLLELGSAGELLGRLQRIYKRELSLLKALLSENRNAEKFPFSKN